MAVVAISPDFNLHHHDSNGNPASGWLVYTFVSNTTNLKDSYSNPAGSIKHTNPIVLDARGEYPGQGLYLIAGEAYTLELRNPQNVPVKTVDNVYGSGAATGGTSTVTLPPHTAYANELESTYLAHPVEIVETLVNKDDALIVSVGAVNEALASKLNNSGNDTFDGNLTVTGAVDASSVETNTLTINGTDVNDIFVNEEGHTGRTLVGNKDASTGAVEDIPIANDLFSNSADVIPSVKAVVDGIADAIANIPNPDNFTVKATATDANPSYLYNKLEAGDGIAITTDNDVVTIATTTSLVPPAAFNSSTSSSVLWNIRCPDVPGQMSPFKYWWTTSNSFQLEQEVVTDPQWNNTTKVFTASKEGRWLFSGSRSGSDTNPQLGTDALYALVRRATSGAGDIYPCANDGAVTAVLDLRVGDQVYFAVHSLNGDQVQPVTYSTYTFAGHSLEIASGGSDQYDPTRVVYVSNSGSDNNDGKTPWTAKQHLNIACDTAKGKQINEGEIAVWTVVCEDSSTFDSTNLYIAPNISIYAPNAVLNETGYLAIPEGTDFTMGKVVCNVAYTTNQTDTVSASRITTVNIPDFTFTSDNGYGLISTGGNNNTTNFNIGRIHGTATTYSGSGVIGVVYGPATGVKQVTFNVDEITMDCVFQGGSAYGILWNNASYLTCNITFNIGTINAPACNNMLCNVGGSYVTANVGFSNTANICSAYGDGINVINGGTLLGRLGELANAPTVKINANFDATDEYTLLGGTGTPIIELSRHGQITIKGSDIPAHLKDKLVAGDNITITEVDGTLRFDSTASGSAVTGTGTETHHTLWTGTDTIGDSIVQEDANGNIVTGGLTQLGEDAHNNNIRGGGNYLSGACTNNDIDGTSNFVTDGNSNHIKGSNNNLGAGSNENVVLGDNNIIDNDVNETATIGTNNRIRNSASQTQIMGHNNDVEGPDNIVIGDRNYMPTTTGEKVIIGNDNRVESPEAMAFGTDNYESAGGGDSHMFGHANNLVNASACEVFGSTNDLDDVSGVMVFGKDIVVNDTQDNPNGVHIGAGGANGVLHIHGTIQGADNEYATAGKTIGFDANGQVIIVDPAISGLATYHYHTGGDVNGAFFLKRIINATDSTNYQQFLVIDSDVCKMTALLSYFGEGEQPKVNVLTLTRRADSREGSIGFKWAKGANNNETYIKVTTGWTGYQYNVTLSSLETLQTDSAILDLDTSFVDESVFDSPNYQRLDVLKAGSNVTIDINDFGERTVNATSDGFINVYSGTGIETIPMFEFTQDENVDAGSYYFTVSFSEEGNHGFSGVLTHDGSGGSVYINNLTMDPDVEPVTFSGKYVDNGTTRTFKIVATTDWTTLNYSVRARALGGEQPVLTAIADYSIGTAMTITVQGGGGDTLWEEVALGTETATTPVTEANPIAVDQIAFSSITYHPTHREGKLYYNKDSHSLQMDGTDNTTHLEIGREQWLRVKNTSGVTIPNGAVVVITGGITGLTDTVATCALAQANSKVTCHTIAFATSTIANGVEGEVCTYGFTRGVDLNGFGVGTVLYVSSSVAGALTATEPSYPYFSAKVGVVMKSGTTDGVLFVSPDTDPNYQTGTGPGASQGGETFAIAVADGTVSTNDQNGNGSYFSCVWIPKATITINGLACFCTQADRWTAGRMGIYTRGAANDTLVAQSASRTTNLAIGFNTFNLVTPYTVQANTPYMLAAQFIAVVQLGKATGLLNPNAPNHFARVDLQNAPPVTTTMIVNPSYSPSTTRIWIGAY